MNTTAHSAVHQQQRLHAARPTRRLLPVVPRASSSAAPTLDQAAARPAPSTSAPQAALRELLGDVATQHALAAGNLSSHPGLMQRGIDTICGALANDTTLQQLLRPSQEKATLASLFHLVSTVFPEHLKVISSDEEAGCAALVAPLPEPLPTLTWSTAGQAARHTWGVLSGLRPGSWLQASHELELMDAKRQAFVQEHGPSLYLVAIGTAPGKQGQGLGGKVLKALTHLADSAQVPLYLEASCERNAALYARNGFLVLGQEPTFPGAPPLTFMWRPPQQCPAKL